ncbi:hypothetical protein jhhlp_000083 [Lomentospora prolificans]|uniref:Uncharacterized protein n=1 Tax=Lomentospora prolificans TaxID=41688 RepID=A0A2N3NLR0_9PEZI|nr:hypothetical protein jhhlp_000083 [Lomentospora prolificans]
MQSPHQKRTAEFTRRRTRRYRLENPRQLRRRQDVVDPTSSESEASDEFDTESEDEQFYSLPTQKPSQGGFSQIPAPPLPPPPTTSSELLPPPPTSASEALLPPPPPPTSVVEAPPTTTSRSVEIPTLTARPHASVGNPFGIGFDPDASPALNVQDPTADDDDSDTETTTLSTTPQSGLPAEETTALPISVSLTSTMETVSSFSTTTVFPTETFIPIAEKEFRKEEDHKHDGDKIVQSKSAATAEHILIGGGSIGAFVGVCVLSWLVWRFANGRKKRGSTYTSSDASSYGPPGKGSLSRQARLAQVLGAIPWIKNRPFAQKWRALDDEHRPVPAMSEKSFTGTQQDPSSGFNFTFGGQRPSTSGSLGMPQLNTNVSQHLYNTVEVSPVSSFQVSTSPSPFDDVNAMETANAPRPAVVASHQHQVSDASLQGQYGTWVYRAIPDGSSSQPGTYKSEQRQAYRVSELSSLSSGFGDGDIIIQQTWPGQGLGIGTVVSAAVVPQPPAATVPPQNVRQSVAQASDTGWSRRDTIYTETSEDLPPRFRNINSWVDQQKGRIQRAVKRAKDGELSPEGSGNAVPPVPGIPAGAGPHGLPPEPQFNMMMPDGEVPRKVDT